MGVKITNITYKQLHVADWIGQTSELVLEVLQKAKIPWNKFGLLINTSVYTPDYHAEPSMASVIQNRVERDLINSGQDFSRKLFSFDLTNGSAGMLNAMEVAGEFIKSGFTEHALIIGGDINPIENAPSNVHLKPVAFVAILSKSEDDVGFIRFKTYDFSEYNDRYLSQIKWKKNKNSSQKRNILEIDKKSEYQTLLEKSIFKSLERFQNQESDKLHIADQIIFSVKPEKNIGAIHSLTSERATISYPVYNSKEGEIVTASLALAFSQNHNDFQAAKTVLFVAANPGISVSLALYKNAKLHFEK